MTDPHVHQPIGRDYWEDRYAEPGYTWSGNPNAVLVTETSDLTPGRALDVGSGEGGDAFWLAQRGWTVTGIDISQNALDKAKARIESNDPEAAVRIRWEQHDLSEWSPPARSFDLISSHFMHLPNPRRSELFRDLATAVAPGGTLLIVAHDVSSLPAERHQAHFAELMYELDDILTAIDGEQLQIATAESRERPATPAQEVDGPVRDIIVRATRAK